MIKIQNVNDAAYKRFGKVITDIELGDLLQAMEATPCPDDVVYVASEAALEATKSAEKFQEIYYGKLPIQVGYCNGHNSLLNALEYHRCGEVNVAVTDLIVLVGSLVDVADDFTYDTSKVEAFFVPAGTAFEMYETTLHYAPCGVDGKGFKDVIILPKGTNADITKNPEAAGEDRLLTAENKWLIAHADAKIDGAFNGLQERISLYCKINCLQFTGDITKALRCNSCRRQTPQVPVIFFIIIHYFERPAPSVRLVKAIHLRAML